MIKKTLDPVWNETIHFDNLVLGSVVKMKLTMKVWDYDGYTSFDDDLGMLTASLDVLETYDRVPEVGQKLSMKGSIYFSFEWVPATFRQPR